MPASILGRRPVGIVLAGALTISFSGILYRLAEVSPTTGAFFRCAWALPLLWLLARLEDRRFPPRPTRARALAWVAGAFFAADLILWHNSIEQVGAGLATVLGNTQVVLVALLAWLTLGERPPRAALAAIPVVVVGVILISGVLEDGRVRCEPAARSALRRPDRRRVLRASCSRCARGTATSAGLPARSSTPRSPQRSAAGSTAPSPATST